MRQAGRSHTHKLRVFFLSPVAFIAVAAVFSPWSCTPETFSAPMASITIGTVQLEPSAPIIIADEKQFFTENGLNVILEYYDSGLSAVSGMLNGEVDVAAPVAEYVLVAKAFNEDKVKAVASINEIDYAYLLGRKDHGIQTIADLKGKKVGVPKGTILEFYLGRFLQLRGMSAKDVIPVDVKLGQSADEIINGDVDAVISFQPYTTAAQNELGDNVVLWPAQSSQALYALIICSDDQLNDHPELNKRLLKSLALAEDYIIKNPQEARAITQKRLDFDDAYMDAVWPKLRFSLSLDQSLITAMEDEARWMISNNLTNQTMVPDFLQYIYVDGLEQIEPQAVNIIR
jgi:NitT/TauT family transport system substrate-binding protein